MDHEIAAPMAPNGNGHGLGELAAALAKAQAAFPKLLKDQTANAGTYSYKYADLATLIEVVRAPLAANGLAYVQLMDVVGDGHQILITRLMHTGGAYLDSRYALASHTRPQEMGSEITYARRYALSALLGVASEADDDAQAAQTSAEAGTRAPAQAQADPWEGAQLELPTPAEIAAAFRNGAKTCPVCKKPAILKSKDRPEWFCWAKRGGCGEKFPDLEPGETAKPAVHIGTITKEYVTERDRLLTLAGQISDELQAPEEDRKTWWGTYCPGATRNNVALKPLGELVSYLNLRLDKARA